MVAYIYTISDSENELVAQFLSIFYGVTGFAVSFITVIISHYLKKIQVRDSIQSATTELRRNLNYEEDLSALFLSLRDLVYIIEFDKTVRSQIKKLFIRRDFKKLCAHLSHLVNIRSLIVFITTYGGQIVFFGADGEMDKVMLSAGTATAP